MTAGDRRIARIRRTGRIRLGAVLVAAVVPLVAACSGGGDDAQPSTSPSVTATEWSPSVTASPTPAAKPSNVYPTNASGCHPSAKWSTAKAADWVHFGQIGRPSASAGEVTFGRSTPGFDGPLCDPVTVQVQYWRVNYRPTTASPGIDSEVKYDFAMRSLKRTELRVDGRKAHAVHPPKGFATLSPCDGYLEAIYVGRPLTSRELPTKISTGSVIGDTVTFPTKRVTDYQVYAPSSPGLCDQNGRPTASAAPSYGLGIPTPTLPSFSLAPNTG
jgi:hypothetical protein